MATLKLNAEAKAKRIAKIAETQAEKVVEKKCIEVLHPAEAEQRANAEMNRKRAKQWLDATYPKLLSNRSAPFEVGLSKKIRRQKPSDIPSNSIDFWINAHCKSPEYLAARAAAERGELSRVSLEEFKA